jgi:hypothetical protein
VILDERRDRHLRVDKFSEQISEVPLQSLSEQERAEDTEHGEREDWKG